MQTLRFVLRPFLVATCLEADVHVARFCSRSAYLHTNYGLNGTLP